MSEFILMNIDSSYTRKMVPITGQARSFLLVFKNKIERRGRQNKNNRPINLPNVITVSTDFKYTTQSTINQDLYFFQLWVSMLLEHQV